jgi:hypothetical protein
MSATASGDAGPWAVLAELLDPISFEEFVEGYYETRPLLVRGKNPAAFDRLLTLDDADRLLSESYLRSEFVRVVQDGQGRSLREGAGEGGIRARAASRRSSSSTVKAPALSC